MNSERDQLYDALTRRLAASRPEDAWSELKGAGVVGLHIAETLGGLGLAVAEAEPVMAALGDTGRATPFLETSIVAAGIMGRAPDPPNALLRAMAEHGSICAVAGLDPRFRCGISAQQGERGWMLSGEAKLVLHAKAASAIMMLVPLGGDLGAFLIDRQDQLCAHTYHTIDGRTASDLVLDGVPATLLSSTAGAAVESALDEAQACLAIEAAAIMRRLVRDTVEYARHRRQFGQALSDFQVIQHRLVDMHIAARRASAIARRAMEALDGPEAARSRLVSAAKATAASAGRFVGQQAVQLHGAMGMTQELPLSGLFRRLTIIENELGSKDEHVARHARFSEPG